MRPATVFSMLVWLLMLGIASGRPAISEAGSDSDMDVTNDYTEILSMRENLRLALNGLDEDSTMTTAGIGRMGLFSARLVHFFLCSIYGVKNEHQKNMPQLRRYVASSLVPLRPKVIKYGLRFLKWTIRNVSTLCQNLINFILNFQFEKKVP